mgnify:CR=1 FL=1
MVSHGQTVVLFVLTAGVSLNNGLKTFLAALFTNGRKFFRPKYLLLGIILPAALMWAVARVEYRTFVWPKEMARHGREGMESITNSTMHAAAMWRSILTGMFSDKVCCSVSFSSLCMGEGAALAIGL